MNIAPNTSNLLLTSYQSSQEIHVLLLKKTVIFNLLYVS